MIEALSLDTATLDEVREAFEWAHDCPRFRQFTHDHEGTAYIGIALEAWRNGSDPGKLLKLLSLEQVSRLTQIVAAALP